MRKVPLSWRKRRPIARAHRRPTLQEGVLHSNFSACPRQDPRRDKPARDSWFSNQIGIVRSGISLDSISSALILTVNSTEPNPRASLRFVPFNLDTEAAAPLCVAVVQRDRHPTVPVLRTTAIATAYLGAICDVRGNVLSWLELWFPHSVSPPGAGPEGAPVVALGVNAQWSAMIRGWERSDSSGFIKTGWETGLPRPLILQMDTLAWASAEATEHIDKSEARFVLADTAPGGGMAARRIALLGLAEYADILAGNSSFDPTIHEDIARHGARESGVGETASNVASKAPEFLTVPHHFLMRARAGRREWVGEIMALKMRLLCQAVTQVRRGIALAGQPFLCLSEHSFAVRFGLASQPVQLWDFEVLLHAASCAAVRPSAGVNVAWRAARDTQVPPAYELPSVGQRLEREVPGRLRLVTRKDGHVLVEATLGRCDEENVGGMLGCLHLPLQSGRRAIWGRLSRDSALARDEVRFRSFSTDFDNAVTAELERMQGFVWPSVFLEIHPAAGYGDDLHSLGVLAVRVLLTSESRQLPAALDAVFSVIQRLRETMREGSLATQLRDVFAHEPRFSELIHPGRGVVFPIARDEAIESVGEGNAWELLSYIVRLFPTALPSAFCRVEHSSELTAFPRAFDEAVAAAEALCRRLTDQVLPPSPMNVRIRAITNSLRNSSELAVPASHS